MLDFAAAGEAGLLKTLAEMSPTTLLRDFKRGIFSLGAAMGAVAIAAGLIAAAGVWLDLRTAPTRKLVLTVLIVLATAGTPDCISSPIQALIREVARHREVRRGGRAASRAASG